MYRHATFVFILSRMRALISLLLRALIRSAMLTMPTSFPFSTTGVPVMRLSFRRLLSSDMVWSGLTVTTVVDMTSPTVIS